LNIKATLLFKRKFLALEILLKSDRIAKRQKIWLCHACIGI
jgi:hypothetical protein